MIGLFLIASLIIIVDRIAKFLAFNYLTQDRSIEVIPKFFHLTLVLNNGSAFGLFKGYGPFFIAASSIIIALILVYGWRGKCKDPVILSGLGLILGGAVGNLIDRILFGYVIDFLDFRIWPVFNIADSAITVGAALLIFKFFFDKKCYTQ